MFTASLAGDPIVNGSPEGDASLIEQVIVNDLKRGVHVNVVADGHKAHDLWDRVAADAVAAGVGGNFKVYYCHNSCYEAGGGIMHNKFITVDYLTFKDLPAHDAVLQTSANLNQKHLSSLEIPGNRGGMHYEE
jgi:phosphatidylserine/phosphatidylglycerophosphate/cardiolipin synthase-like enzyme